jgi:hypothetical protein
MLHITWGYLPFRIKDRDSVKVFGNRENIQLQFTKYLEDMYFRREPNHLRHPLVCRYLKEDRSGIYWVDDYTIMMKEEHRDAERAVPYVLDYSIQLTMQLIYLSTIGVTDVVLRSYIPWVADTAWLSEHCNDMNIYIPCNRTMPIDECSSREIRASQLPGIFDLIYKGKHYHGDYLHFKYDVLYGAEDF